MEKFVALYDIPDREELAWAAGFFDGEGYVGNTRQKNHNGLHYKVPVLSIRQVDRRVLDRFHKVVGIGTVSGPYRHGRTDPKHKSVFSYQTRALEKIQHVMCLLWTWLGPVKREQFKITVREIVQYHNLPRGQKGVPA